MKLKFSAGAILLLSTLVAQTSAFNSIQGVNHVKEFHKQPTQLSLSDADVDISAAARVDGSFENQATDRREFFKVATALSTATAMLPNIASAETPTPTAFQTASALTLPPMGLGKKRNLHHHI